MSADVVPSPAFSDGGNPTLATLLKVLDALDLEPTVRAKVAA